MSEEINIKINIAGRVYPLKVTQDEEEKVRKAAKRLNERIRQYKQDFEVKDNHDFLSMCALEFATRVVKLEDQNLDESKEVADIVEAMEQSLQQAQ